MLSFVLRKNVLGIIFCSVALAFSHVAYGSSVAEQTAKDFTAVAKQAIPAVVSIQVKGSLKAKSTRNGFRQDTENPYQDFFGDDFFQRFFGLPKDGEEDQTIGQASGYIISADGLIFTNSHVVKNASEITVVLNDGREFQGKVLGQDPNTDVALIKIDAKDLPFLKLGNSDKMEIGQWVIAIGNPLGLQASLTVGVISAKGRNNLDLANIEDFIQTDAAINRGNSGGPLLSLDAEVIGMNTAIVTNMGTGGYMGIGFAIPSTILRHVMDELLKNGSVTRGFLGITLQSIDSDLAQAFNLKTLNGALISDVSRDSPADKAGLKQGDIILAYNQQSVSNIGSLRNAIALMSPGTKITLTVLRNGKSMDIPAIVGAYPNSMPLGSSAKSNNNKFGFEVQELNPELAKALGITDERGVVITKVEPNSPASWAGLRKGAVITSVNQKAVVTLNEFNDALQNTPPGRPVLLLIKQGDVIRFISLKVG